MGNSELEFGISSVKNISARYSSGTNPTDYTYTGQYSYTDDFGLMFYNARWYDPYLNHSPKVVESG